MADNQAALIKIEGQVSFLIVNLIPSLMSHIPRAVLIAVPTGMFQPRKVPSWSLPRFQSKAFGRESQGLYAVVSVVA